MAELDLSSFALARKARIAESTVRSVRKGRAKPQTITLYRLSRGLDWPGGYLRDVADDVEPPAPLLPVGLSARLDRIRAEARRLVWLPAADIQAVAELARLKAPARTDPPSRPGAGSPGSVAASSGAERSRSPQTWAALQTLTRDRPLPAWEGPEP